jgi:hypothetical protein
MRKLRLGLTNASVFKKCLLLMAGATILVAAVLSVLNIRTTNTAIDNGIRDLAEATTASAAAANGAALRFGNGAALEEALARVLETSDGAALHAIAVNAQGETLVDLGSDTDAGAVALAALARSAAASGEAQLSPDGFLRAVPAFRRLRHGERGGRGRHRLDTRPQPRRRAVPTDHQHRHIRRRAVRPALWRRQPSAHARVQTGDRAGRGDRDPARRPLRHRGAVHRSRGRDRDDRAQPVGPAVAACRRRPRGGGARPHRSGAETGGGAAGRALADRRGWRSDPEDRQRVRRRIRTACANPSTRPSTPSSA